MKKVISTKNIPITRIKFSSKAILSVLVIAISSVFLTGAFKVTQAQQEEQIPFLPIFPSPISPPNETTMSPELIAKMCDPNNPKLEFVNSTESEVCGLPKSIKNVTTPTPSVPPKPISPLSSTPPPTTTSPPKPISPLSPKPITPSEPDELP